MGVKRTLFKNAAVFGGYTSVQWVFDTLISTVILSRLISPEEYGLVAMINIFSGFIALFANTGLSYAIIRSDYGPKYHKIIFNLTTWVGVFLGVMMCVLAYPITLIYGNPDLFWPSVVIAIQFITNSMNIVPMALLQKDLKFNFIGKLNLLTTVAFLPLMILLAVLGFSYWSLIIPMVIQPVFRQILLERKVKFGFHLYGWKLTKLGLKKVRSLLENFSIFNVVNYFARNADNFVIGKYFGEASLGLYSRAYNFLYMARRLVNANLGPILMPSLMKAKKEGEEINQHFIDIWGMLNFINLFVAIPLIFFAKPIVLILWGNDWLGVADFMPYIGIIIPVQTLMISSMDLFVIEHKEKALITLEIPLTLIMIAGIVLGAFFSALHVLWFYSIAFLLVMTPLELYFAHIRLFKFTTRQILIFWGPKISLTGGMLFSVWYDQVWITAILMVLFVFDTVYFQYKYVREILFTVRNIVLEKKRTMRKSS